MVLSIENMIFESSSASTINFLAISFETYSGSFSRDNQYFTSRLSFYAMDILAEKSAFEIAPFASDTLAPIEVPERKSCLDKTYSFLFRVIFLCNCMMFNAKS